MYMLKIANRLTGLLSTWTEYEAALKVAIPATERLKSLGCDTISEYTNMLIYIGCAESRLGLSEDKTDDCLEEAYRAHINNIRKHPYAISYRDAIVGVINISYNYLEAADYENARLWLERMKQLIDGYEKQADARPDYTEKQRARYNIYLARALEGWGARTKPPRPIGCSRRQNTLGRQRARCWPATICGWQDVGRMLPTT